MAVLVVAPGSTAFLSLNIADGEAGLFSRATVYDEDGDTVVQAATAATEAQDGLHVVSFAVPAGEADYHVRWELFTDAGFTTEAGYTVTSDSVLARDYTTQADLDALNDLSVADVQSALTAQGYTTGRAPALDNLDAAVSSRAVPGDQMALTAGAIASAADAVWDEVISGHLTEGTAGHALAALQTLAGPATFTDAVTYDANFRPTQIRRRLFATDAAAAAATVGGSGEGEILTITLDATHIDAARWETLVGSSS